MGITPETVVIVRNKNGFIAHIRYKRKKFDFDIASNNKVRLYTIVESIFRSAK